MDEEQMIRNIAEALITSEGLEAPVPEVSNFDVSGKASSDIKRGLAARIAKTLETPVTMLFLEYMNDIGVLDLYLEDEEHEDAGSWSKDFEKHVTADGCAVLKEKIPAITGRVREQGKAYARAMSEMIGLLDDSCDFVCDALLGGRCFGAVAGILPDAGDVHNGGRSTCVIDTDEGRIVYKPHDVMTDHYMKDLIDRFFPDIMRAPGVCPCGEYGFEEFIENRPADTDASARRWFYSLGGMTAVIQMLGSTDLHHSNVLACGTRPVIVDCELMLTPGTKGAESGLARDIRNSLYYSSLMPSRSLDSEMSILFAKDEANPSSPVVDGERKNICDYPDEFFAGFRETYESILERREELKRDIRGMRTADVRHILRNTSLYSELVKRMLEPARLREKEEDTRAELIRALSRGPLRSGMSAAEEIVSAEADSLMAGEVPYFYMKARERGLWTGGKEVYKDFMPQSPLDNALGRLEYMSADDLGFEEELLRKAMDRVITRRHHEDEEDVPVSEDACITDEQLIKEAERIFCGIEKDALKTPGGHLVWFGPDYYLRTGMDLLGAGLYSGSMGIAVFAAALYAVSEDPEIKKRARKLSETITGTLADRAAYLEGLDHIVPNTDDLSMSRGLAGRLVGCHLIEEYTEDGSLRGLCERIIRLMERAEPDFSKTDVYSGMAGVIKALTCSGDIFSMPGAAELTAKFAGRLRDSAAIPYRGRFIWKTIPVGCAISGCGHGQSGIASALYAAGKRLGRKDLVEAAMPGFAFERETFSESMNAWPDRRLGPKSKDHLAGYCSGAPGIGLDALRTGYEGSAEVLEKAIKSCLAEPLQHKDLLCCGNSAISEFLLEAGTALDDGRLINAARARMALVMERAEKNGGYINVSKGTSPVFSPGLFYGNAGIGYEMLRLAAPDRIKSLLI